MCGLSTCILGFYALPLWTSGYAATLALLLDLIAIPPFFIAIGAGLLGLKKDKGGFALAGSVLAVIPVLMTYLFFNDRSVADLFRRF